MSYDTSVLAAEHILALSAQISRALGEAREEIDALNVFPVPDSDTGTNLALTFDEAHDVLTHFYRDSPGATVSEAAAVYRRALLMAARGNSGVIMSQLCGAMLRKLDEPPGSRFLRHSPLPWSLPPMPPTPRSETPKKAPS